MTRDELKEKINRGRTLAKTDLLWLTRNILFNPETDKTVPRVHAPIAKFLQQFPEITPEDPFQLPSGDGRRRLLLAPRGWFKTTLNVVGHSIQWILNYPDITILILHASQEMAEHILGEIKGHFQYNPAMRFFFPEMCPDLRNKEFGTRTYFNCPARKILTKTPTISVSGLESVRTGMHYHVIKYTDIVEAQNSLTPEQCQKVYEAYTMTQHLLINPRCWADIEGTRYNLSDVYGRIIDRWLSGDRSFKIFVMGCYEKDVAEEKFTPDELDLPYKMESGKPVSRFPEHETTEELEVLRAENDTQFAAQKLNDPLSTSTGSPFPLDKMRWTDAVEKIPFLYKIVTVDTAERTSKHNDYTVVTCCGWDRWGRCYVVDVRIGRFSPEQTVNELLAVYMKWRPYRIYLEDTGFIRGLMPTIQRRGGLAGIALPIELLTRSTRTSKRDRILGLEPFYRQGLIIFSTDIPAETQEHIKKELSRFPIYRHDDFLDTLSDQFLHKKNFAPAGPSRSEMDILRMAEKRLLAFEKEYEAKYGEKPPQMYPGMEDSTGLYGF